MLPSGSSAPDVNLPGLDGSEWDLRNALRDGPVVLAFFKISCPTCQMTFPFLQRLADAEKGSAPNGAARLIAISQDDVPDTHEFQQRLGLAMPTLTDAPPAWEASNAYRITNVPSVFTIETDGTISAAFDGFNKAEIEKLGRRFGVTVFRDDERVPSLRPG